MDIKELKEELFVEVTEYLDSFKKDILSILSDKLDSVIEDNKDKMILDVDNFIFEMNKENNLLTVALKEFIDYYIKYKQ